ncbi:MAG TPA: cohesin domain-containing protein [Terriglobales bacterium]|nr:cohesin domain-containing protein [Terriglobales bacterium]
MRRWGKLLLCASLGLLAAGCPKGNSDFDKGQKAEDLKDVDSAVQYYQKAVDADPHNASFKIKLNQARFDAGEFHVKQGLRLREAGNLQGAAGEFQRAVTIDPSSPVAAQELRTTLDLMTEKAQAEEKQAESTLASEDNELASGPPELKPLSQAPITLKMTNDAKIVFETIGKLAGVSMVFDPDFTARRVSVDLNNVTLEQALDIVSFESKAFWRPETENIIFVIPDQAQKHRDYDEQVVKTFYLSNTIQPQDLTEITNGLRQVLNLTKVQQLNSENAIIIRDTPDKLAIAAQMIRDIDKARPEVVIQVEVLSASTDRLRDLGILPGQSASISFTGTSTTSTSSSSGTSTPSTPSVPLSGFHCCANYYSVTLPGATANMVLTDTETKIIQNPEIRSVDGQDAKLNIGSRVPIATGSFQAGVGVGTTAVNPLVNTQFQYLDVGVNVDITPRVHLNHEISLKMKVEVSQVTGTSTIGGIQQPIIGQNKAEQEVRLKDGEVNILAGLFQRIDSNTLNGWPGLAQVPLLKYLFADNKTEHQTSEILIAVIPHIVRLPDWTKEDLRPIYTGSEQNIQTRKESEIRAPVQQPAVPKAQMPTPAGVPAGAKPTAAPASGQETNSSQSQGPRLHFEPQTLTLKVGQTATLGIVVDNVNDLFSIPMLLQYSPSVISVDELQHGTFLSGGNQEIALVQQVNQKDGQAIVSATRQPNTPGVSGSGTLLGVVIKALAPGTTTLSIVQVNAKDSQQKPIPLLTGEATIQVQP